MENAGINIRDFTEHFKNRLMQIDRDSEGIGQGEEPEYPLILITLGESAIRKATLITSRLFELWPQYEHEIPVIGVKNPGSGKTYYKIDPAVRQTDENPAAKEQAENEQAENGQAVPEEELPELITDLFSTENHFHDSSLLMLYFVIDTTDTRDVNEFQQWMQTVSEVKSAMGLDQEGTNDLFCVLLNEDLGHRRFSKLIRNRLAAAYDDAEQLHGSVLLISNRRSDNRVETDQKKCCHILADCIALSDCREKYATEFFKGKVLTTAYACVEKPIDEIGQVVVTQVLDKLDADTAKMPNIMNDQTLDSKLGLTRNGTIAFADRYVEDCLCKKLPENSELEYFPRKDMSSEVDLSELSAEQFNDITMNAGSALVKQIVEQAETDLCASLTQELLNGGTDKNSYISYLRNTFTNDELIQLSQHIADVRKHFGNVGTESVTGADFYSAAEKEMKRLLSGSTSVINCMIKAIETLGKNAEEFWNNWDELQTSRRKLYRIDDSKLEQFYSKVVQRYFDYHDKKVIEDFKGLHDAKGLEKFLTETIDGVIDNHDIFRQSFEEELQTRLRADDSLVNAKNYIQSTLTGEDVVTYLNVPFQMDTRGLSVIMLKTETGANSTGLKEFFVQNLSGNYGYYNTGYGNRAEAVYLYEVGQSNLISEE